MREDQKHRAKHGRHENITLPEQGAKVTQIGSESHQRCQRRQNGKTTPEK